MSEPTQWTAQERIHNLADQLDAERKHRITAVWLRSNAKGDEVEVLAEIQGEWRVIIQRQSTDGPISHIVEWSGITRAPKDTPQ